MPRFAANLSTMFTEVPFLERFARAAAAGFAAVECQFPYAEPADAVAAALRAAGLVQVLINLPPGDWAAGERGLAALPGRDEAFAASLDTALAYARALDCPALHCLAGVVPSGSDSREVERTYVGNLKRAAALLAREGRTLLIEPLNPGDAPGYHLARLDDAARVIAQVGAPNLRLQFDAYHCRIVHGEPAAVLADYLPLVGHVQVADVPGRHEPGSGEIDFTRFFRRLDEAGYAGWVGCEYRPAGRTEDGLGWRERLA